LKLYVDTSVMLRAILGQGPRLRGWGSWEAAYTSEISHVEGRRAIDRLRLEGALDDEGVADARETLEQVERSLGMILVTRGILRRAAMPMATVIGTLDAIHLASAILCSERKASGLSFATHDRQQARAARAMGLPVIGT